MKRRILIVLPLVALVCGLVLFRFFINNSPDIRSNVLWASVRRVEGNSVFVSGRYMDDNNRFLDQEKYFDVEVKITEKTVMKKEVIYPPTNEAIEAMGGSWFPEQAPKSLHVGSVKDFKGPNFPILITSEKNIFGKKSITAAEIFYSIIYLPPDL